LKILDDQELDTDSIRSVKTLLSKEGGAELVETLINEGFISSKDIVNTSFRKRGVQIFKEYERQSQTIGNFKMSSFFTNKLDKLTIFALQ
jgi:DNA-binding winged helix-turn-helix (wHTH) protein